MQVAVAGGNRDPVVTGCTVAASGNQRSTSTAWENTPSARRPRRVPRCTRSTSSRRATCWASGRGTSTVAEYVITWGPLVRDLIFENPVLPGASRLSRAGPTVRTHDPGDQLSENTSLCRSGSLEQVTIGANSLWAKGFEATFTIDEGCRNVCCATRDRAFSVLSEMHSSGS
jgi:hypothetical protein